ncbi:MAG TPA: hypothetical protein VFQ39_17680 [Longimicrobium sp.]|nr:hypothetical protein [Longimicrobium sp.]
MPPRAVAALPLVLLLSAPLPPRAQAVVEVPDAPACARCRIVFERVATLGGADDPESPGYDVTVERDRAGRFYVAPVVGRDGIAVYAPDGRFLRKIGRKGEGPGEFGFVLEARVGPGDSLYVSDLAPRRLTVLAPGGGAVVRTSPLLGETRSFVLGRGGELLAHASIATAARAGYPLHRLSPRGEVLRSFGADAAGVMRPDRPADGFRVIAPARGGNLWSAPINRYRIELWDPREGRLLKTLVRRTDWFPDWHVLPRGYPDLARPVTAVEGIREDASGLLWVFLRTADARWTAAPRPRDPSRERGVVPMAELHRYLDTVVEVIDPVRGRLVATGRAARHYEAVSLNGTGLVHSRREGADGVELLDVWEVKLINP